ncbi:MAG: DUF4340 domain-containing protein [Clostridia bacterium]|nr:DUF4340 domain-containing protein [Clostridia bacterium]
MQHPPKKNIKTRKSRWIAPAILLVCLLLAAAFVLLLPQIRAAYRPKTLQIFTETAAQQTFAITPQEQLDSVTIIPSYGESYTLRMQDGTLWLEENDTLTDINDAYAQELLNAVTQIVAQNVVTLDAAEVESQLDNMGLLKPRATAVIRYTDGTETTLKIGGDVPNTTYAYCQWSGNTAVYMCDSGVVDALTLTKKSLYPVQQPVIYAGLLDELTIENAADQCTFTFRDGAYGMLEQPFFYPLDASASAQLLSVLDNFRLGTREATVTEDNRSLYGFDMPLCTVTLNMSSGVTSEVDENGELVTRMRQAQSLRFIIGRAEGEYFYTCEYEGECYLVSRFLVQWLIDLKRDEMLSRKPLDAGDLAVHRISITTPAGTAELYATRTERVLPNNELEVDANGNVVYDMTVTLNGKPAAKELLDEVVSRLDAVTSFGSVPQDWTGGETRWAVVLETESGLVRTVEATRLDLFTDVIAVDGVALHCVDAETIDIIAEGLI